MITLPSKYTKLYAIIKRAADVHVGVHTICAVASRRCVGKDRSGASMTLPSIAAVVATGESTYFVHWPASIRLQKPDKGKGSQELSDDLQAMVTKRVEHWRRKNGKLPEQVIIYRDGVSDGFYRLIKHYELAKIRLAFENVTRGYDPAMIYLVVLKRHPTRFFPSPAVSTAQQDHFTNPRLLDSRSNSKPGLLFRDTLTPRRDEVGYFLQSHECLKGELPRSFIRWLVL